VKFVVIRTVIVVSRSPLPEGGGWDLEAAHSPPSRVEELNLHCAHKSSKWTHISYILKYFVTQEVKKLIMSGIFEGSSAKVGRTLAVIFSHKFSYSRYVIVDLNGICLFYLWLNGVDELVDCLVTVKMGGVNLNTFLSIIFIVFQEFLLKSRGYELDPSLPCFHRAVPVL
jgi:hypothetical protein